MKILAIDIGAGTKDVFLFDDKKKTLENCVKMVLPSPSLVFTKKVKEATKNGRDLLVKGSTIGGGNLSAAFRDHVENGLEIMMTKTAAYTISNDLNKVRKLNIRIVKEEEIPPNFRGKIINLREVDLPALNTFLLKVGETLSDVDIVAIAVQDHGIPSKGESNRRFRIRKMKELLKNDPRIESLAFKKNEIPPYFIRMRSAVQDSRIQLPKARILVMDTSPNAFLGCLKDRTVEKANTILAVNVGNSHVTAAIIVKGKIRALMEHHTNLLDSDRLEHLLARFVKGKITDLEIFNENGHGLFFLSEPKLLPEIDIIAATGPNRDILLKTDLSVHFSAPAGDVMMTGPIGLIEAAMRKFAN